MSKGNVPGDPAANRSRRSVLAAAAAATGAMAVHAIVHPEVASAANVALGAVNTATAATTIQSTEATTTATAIVGRVVHTGPGPSTAGVEGRSDAQGGTGVRGIATRGSGARGVHGRSVIGTGVYGEATNPSAANVGVLGTTGSTAGKGVYGLATGASGLNYGVYGQSDSPGGRGVHGIATATAVGGSAGVTGRAHASDGKGVYGFTSSPTGSTYGVLGQTSSTTGYGVVGLATSTSGAGRGVQGQTNSPSGVGVVGMSLGGYGIFGQSSAAGGRAVYGFAGGSGTTYGIVGSVSSPTGYAGHFFGRGLVTGSLTVLGPIFKGGGGFLIDHPLEPASQYLEHSFVEAPERLNVYRGTVVLDGRGSATIRLPRYFGALNVDLGYQLTALGLAAPGLHVVRKVPDGGRSFRIAGGSPGQEVCWQVTGARRDAWARANPIRVERRKRKGDQGKFLHPEALGRPRSAAIHQRAPLPRVRRIHVGGEAANG